MGLYRIEKPKPLILALNHEADFEAQKTPFGAGARETNAVFTLSHGRRYRLFQGRFFPTNNLIGPLGWIIDLGPLTRQSGLEALPLNHHLPEKIENEAEHHAK